MAEAIPPEVLRQALKTAYSDVAKATQSNQQQQQPTVPPAQAQAVAVGTAGLPAAGALAAGAAGVAAAGAGVAAVGLGRALAMLASIPLRLAQLSTIIGLLYAAAYLRGVREAAIAASGVTPSWLAILPELEGDSEGWSPREAKEALNIAQGGLADVLSERGIWIKEMTTTQVNRVGDAIRESVENGRPLSEAQAAIDAIVHDTARARMIAETEYSRAQGLATMETYRLNRVPMLQWLDHPDACPLCKENAAASPQPTTHPVWPNGGIPVHPHERCAVAPYYPPTPAGLARAR